MAVVQTLSASAASAASVAKAITLTAGNLVIVQAGTEWGGGLPAASISDTAGNTWTLLAEGNPDITDGVAWYCWNCKGGATTITVSSTQGAVNMGFLVREYSGVQATSDPLDQKSTQASGGTTSLSSPASAATTNANDLVIGLGWTEQPSATFTAGAGYGNLSQLAPGANMPNQSLAIEDKTVSATGAQTATMTQSAAYSWIAMVVAFKLAGATTTTTPPAGRSKAGDFFSMF
jgi:hypothetical protein